MPNPGQSLLPGMFVRVEFISAKRPDTLLVPQQAVTRDQKGQAVAMVVNGESKVERRQLVTERAVGDSWLVTAGVAAGDRVIVEGLQKVRPGAQVKPVPAAESAARAQR
jgi:membrane fusion protein (multidrug efflux system)